MYKIVWRPKGGVERTPRPYGPEKGANLFSPTLDHLLSTKLSHLAPPLWYMTKDLKCHEYMYRRLCVESAALKGV